MIPVAVGILEDAEGRILVARRPEHKHQGGKWEFTGGKIEAGEIMPAALARELHEELGIQVRAASPMLRVHRLPDLVAASCHNATELARAVDLGAVFHCCLPCYRQLRIRIRQRLAECSLLIYGCNLGTQGLAMIGGFGAQSRLRLR